MRNTSWFSLAAAAFTLVLGCSGGEKQSEFITITSPTPGQEFSEGDSLVVQGSIQSEDGEELHGYEIHVIDESTGDVLFTWEEHVHGLLLPFDQSGYTIPFSNRKLKILVISVLDHDGNTARRSVDITVR